jgi:hypothetical protein
VRTHQRAEGERSPGSQDSRIAFADTSRRPILPPRSAFGGDDALDTGGEDLRTGSAIRRATVKEDIYGPGFKVLSTSARADKK